jgi:hypothetical protein
MRRDVLLLAEMIDAAEQAQHLADGVIVEELEADRRRRDALLWTSASSAKLPVSFPCSSDRGVRADRRR